MAGRAIASFLLLSLALTALSACTGHYANPDGQIADWWYDQCPDADFYGDPTGGGSRTGMYRGGGGLGKSGSSSSNSSSRSGH